MASVSDYLRGYLESGGVKVYLKTNLGERIPIYTGKSAGPGILSRLGIEAGIVVEDDQGRTLASFNGQPPTDPIRRALALAILAGLAFVLARGVMP